MFLTVVFIILTMLLLFLGLTWNSLANEPFHAQNLLFGTRFNYSLDRNISGHFRKDLKTVQFKQAFTKLFIIFCALAYNHNVYF